MAASWDWVCCCSGSEWLVLTCCWTRLLSSESCALLDQRGVGTDFTMCCFFEKRPFPFSPSVYSFCCLSFATRGLVGAIFFFLSLLLCIVSLISCFFTLSLLTLVRPSFPSVFPRGIPKVFVSFEVTVCFSRKSRPTSLPFSHFSPISFLTDLVFGCRYSTFLPSVLFCHASSMALRIVMTAWWPVCPLWSRLKYLNSYWMYCHEIWFRHSCPPQDEL